MVAKSINLGSPSGTKPAVVRVSMSECTEAAEVAPLTHTKESHYQLSKKVAQLIKVIVQLNTDNENYTADKKRLIDVQAL